MIQTKHFIVVTALAIALGGTAFAHTGATGIVKERMDAMSDIGKSMKTIGAFLKGERPYDASVTKAAAETIGGHAKHVPHLFPKGSTKKPSEALPAIWEDWKQFTTIAADMEAAAKALAEAADGAKDANGIKPMFASLGQTCKACHQKFRLKK